MPRLLQRVYQCKIVSARSTFEPFAPSTGPFEWKLLAFHMAAEVLFGARFPKPVVRVMKPRQIVVLDKRCELDESHGDEDVFDNDDSSDTLSEEVDRLREVSIDNSSNSEGATDKAENCIVQFSQDCLNRGGYEVRTKGVSLTTSATGLHNYGGHDGFETQSTG